MGKPDEMELDRKVYALVDEPREISRYIRKTYAGRGAKGTLPKHRLDVNDESLFIKKYVMDITDYTDYKKVLFNKERDRGDYVEREGRIDITDNVPDLTLNTTEVKTRNKESSMAASIPTGKEVLNIGTPTRNEKKKTKSGFRNLTLDKSNKGSPSLSDTTMEQHYGLNKSTPKDAK
jgi:hypothetical protein